MSYCKDYIDPFDRAPDYDFVIAEDDDDTLLPCPFCGSSAGDVPLKRGHGFIVGCSNCQAQQFAMEHGDAIKLWNQRVFSSRDAEIKEVGAVRSRPVEQNNSQID